MFLCQKQWTVNLWIKILDILELQIFDDFGLQQQTNSNYGNKKVTWTKDFIGLQILR